MGLEHLSRDALRRFIQVFDRPAQWLVAAPGRVNLIGEHTDYNQGFVLPMAIDRHVVIAAAPSAEPSPPPERVARLLSTASNEEVSLLLDRPPGRGDPPWSNYVRGTIAGFLARGTQVPAFDALIDSSLPVGGGLSSSAALEVATATLLEVMTGSTLNPTNKAQLCQRAEHDFARVPCGIMDQFTSVFGRHDSLLLLDCRSLQIEWVPMRDPSVCVLITNSNVRHSLTDGGYGKRWSECEKAARLLGVRSLREAGLKLLEHSRERLGRVCYRRALHVITENARTLKAAAAIGRGDWDTVGRLFYASHASLRNDYEVSCSELDLLVDLARDTGGVIGARMTGAGFGGCTVTLVRTEAAERVMRSLSRSYFEKTGIEPTLFLTRPAGGAGVLPVIPRGQKEPVTSSRTLRRRAPSRHG